MNIYRRVDGCIARHGANVEHMLVKAKVRDIEEEEEEAADDSLFSGSETDGEVSDVSYF